LISLIFHCLKNEMQWVVEYGKTLGCFT
jgi:hypothetical protein